MRGSVWDCSDQAARDRVAAFTDTPDFQAKVDAKCRPLSPAVMKVFRDHVTEYFDYRIPLSAVKILAVGPETCTDRLLIEAVVKDFEKKSGEKVQ